MIILNFAHPLTEDQRAGIEAATGRAVDDVIDVESQVDAGQPLEPQVSGWLDALAIDAARWQTEGWLVLLPSLNYSTAVLLAALHGRMGYFPTCVRLRPVEGAVVRQFEFAELLDLSVIRDRERLRRS